MHQRVVFCFLILATISGLSQARGLQPLLINGQPVPTGKLEEVVLLEYPYQGVFYKCTGTLVGSRVVLTAAHCGGGIGTVEFTFKNQRYTAKVHRSRLYGGYNHDVAVGVVTTEVVDARPMSIRGTVQTGDEVLLTGYGCTTGERGVGVDGTLRQGKTVVTGFRARYDIVSEAGSRAILCFGDSGGPVFLDDGKELSVVAVNSRVDTDRAGNAIGPSYTTRLDHVDSQGFFKRIIRENGVEICGINKDCD